jgi:protein-tyrosine phosphatase
MSHRPVDDDVVDPYGRGQSVYDESFGLMVPAIDTIVAAVRR